MTGAAPVRIVPLRGHAPEEELIAALSSALESYLRVPTRVAEPMDPPVEAWVDQRLSSNFIVDTLMERFREGEDTWTLAVTSTDLVAPGREFVFGEAALGGFWAVVSSARLVAPDRPELTLERLLKEALHEIGHLGGLGHCSRPDCIMCRSATVVAVDAKQPDFCQKCVSAFFQSARS